MTVTCTNVEKESLKAEGNALGNALDGIYAALEATMEDISSITITIILLSYWSLSYIKFCPLAHFLIISSSLLFQFFLSSPFLQFISSVRC